MKPHQIVDQGHYNIWQLLCRNEFALEWARQEAVKSELSEKLVITAHVESQAACNHPSKILSAVNVTVMLTEIRIGQPCSNIVHSFLYSMKMGERTFPSKAQVTYDEIYTGLQNCDAATVLVKPGRVRVVLSLRSVIQCTPCIHYMAL
jgi:hypothetical protein